MTPLQGRCLRGAVRFSVEVSAKETALGLYKSSEWGERLFCKTCGSSILWRSIDQTFRSVPAALLEGLEDLDVSTEIFIDEKPDYYAFAGARTRMTGAEVFAAFGAGAAKK